MNAHYFVWLLIYLATIILVVLMAKTVFRFYADGVCLERGYRWSTVTLTGHIYCELPVRPGEVLKIQ